MPKYPQSTKARFSEKYLAGRPKPYPTTVSTGPDRHNTTTDAATLAPKSNLALIWKSRAARQKTELPMPIDASNQPLPASDPHKSQGTDASVPVSSTLPSPTTAQKSVDTSVQSVRDRRGTFQSPQTYILLLLTIFAPAMVLLSGVSRIVSFCVPQILSMIRVLISPGIDILAWIETEVSNRFAPEESPQPAHFPIPPIAFRHYHRTPVRFSTWSMSTISAHHCPAPPHQPTCPPLPRSWRPPPSKESYVIFEDNAMGWRSPKIVRGDRARTFHRLERSLMEAPRRNARFWDPEPKLTYNFS